MTDNEKRAHDIAVAYATVVSNPVHRAAEALKRSTETGVDFYVAYKEAYQAALSALNRDFPEGM